jgi:hypothetical protein
LLDALPQLVEVIGGSVPLRRAVCQGACDTLSRTFGLFVEAARCRFRFGENPYN